MGLEIEAYGVGWPQGARPGSWPRPPASQSGGGGGVQVPPLLLEQLLELLAARLALCPLWLDDFFPDFPAAFGLPLPPATRSISSRVKTRIMFSWKKW